MKRFVVRRLTLRARLTLIYGGLFLLAGMVLLAVTYVLVFQRLPKEIKLTGVPNAAGTAGQDSAPQQLFATSGKSSLSLADPSQVQAFVTEVRADAQEKALDSLLTQGGIALGLVGGVAVGFGWLIAGRALQPLHRVTETARRIAQAPAADRGLHERIALSGPPDEIKELADTFDTMLERLDSSFDGQRRFIANASHELRTPLTLNRALLEVAMHRKNASADVQHLADTLLEVNARHERLINGLLLLARSEHDITNRCALDLAEVVEHVTDQAIAAQAEVSAAAAAADAGGSGSGVGVRTRTGVTVRAEAAIAPLTGDPVLLERLVQNLVENGVRHNVPRDGWVRVASHARPDGWVELTVSNTGPVVPRYEIASLFEPFRRLGAERLSTSPGAGLGLSIVRAIARAHHGDVRAEPRDGGGLVVTVMLPTN
jgi:signal transduction histidine kinase